MENDFLYWLELQLPPLCSVSDLVDKGIFTSEQAAYSARIKGEGPSYFKIRRRIVYPKISVLKYLRQSFHECAI